MSAMWHRVATSFPLFDAVEQQIHAYDSRFPRHIPDVSSGRLILASDYGGSHRESRYDVTSVFITCEVAWHAWEDQRQNVRHAFRLKDRRMSYQKLNDVRKVRALTAFLTAASSARGLLFSLAINKSLPSAFDADTTNYSKDPRLERTRRPEPRPRCPTPRTRCPSFGHARPRL